MCESHMNDTVRKAVPEATKVFSSHGKGTTQLQCEKEPDEAVLRSAIEATGCRMLSMETAPVEKKGLHLFGR